MAGWRGGLHSSNDAAVVLECLFSRLSRSEVDGGDNSKSENSNTGSGSCAKDGRVDGGGSARCGGLNDGNGGCRECCASVNRHEGCADLRQSCGVGVNLAVIFDVHAASNGRFFRFSPAFGSNFCVSTRGDQEAVNAARFAGPDHFLVERAASSCSNVGSEFGGGAQARAGSFADLCRLLWRDSFALLFAEAFFFLANL